ncbi:MAG: general secretion pathway protein GspC [Gammaproteobacteria bacterium]|nr:general secretion pathway protein GspC [Gammaproteobacteria bacterium]
MSLKSNFPKILGVALVLLIVLEWISGIRSGFQLDKRTTPLELPVLKKVSVAPAMKEHLAIKAAFFGDYVPNDVGAIGVKRSSLNISVVGIVFAADEKTSHVMLELPGNQVKMFGVGDEIPGGGVIKRITPDGVLLMRDGIMESLSLPKNELLFAPPIEVLKHD